MLWISPNSWVAHRTTHGGRLGIPNHFELFSLILKDIYYSDINTKLACFPFNHVPTYQELGGPSGNFRGHVGSPDHIMGHIWRPLIHSTVLKWFCISHQLFWVIFSDQNGLFSASLFLPCACWRQRYESVTWKFNVWTCRVVTLMQSFEQPD